MSTPLISTRPHRLATIPALRKTIILALIANVLAYAYAQTVITHHLVPPLVPIMVLTLVVAGVCATRWRWAPLLVAGWCLLIVAIQLPQMIMSIARGVGPAFPVNVASLGLLIIACVAGLVATVQRDRWQVDTPLPRWFPGFLVGVAMFVLGVGLTLTMPKPAATAGVSPAVLASLPGVTTANYQFDQREIKAKVGDTVALHLHNSDNLGHSFDIDTINVHVPIGAGADALALFKPTAAGTYTFYCSVPGHADPKTGTGMVGKLIVAP
jgi:uncharacterized cupredoxin-like copper-binding protein